MYPPEEVTDSRYSFSPEVRPFSVEEDNDDLYETADHCPKRDCPTYTHGAGF